MKRNILLLVCLVVLANCSKNEDNNVIVEPDVSIDEEPQISITEISDLVETKTSFRVSITGTAEQTNTTVLINENELIRTSQKDFELEINPFDYPNGKTSLTVKSSSVASNESVKTEEFEINKLLFRSIGGLSSESVDSYLAINLQSSGELVAYKQIINYDDPIFFHAEDNFIEEDIMVTQYLLGKNSGFHIARIYANVKPGTELMSIVDVANELGIDNLFPSTDSSIDLTIDGISDSGWFSMLGSSYNFNNASFPIFGVNYDSALTDDIFLYYFNQLEGNILDNYRYAVIDTLEDQTIQFDNMATVLPEDVATIELPDNVKQAGISLLGYTNEQSYRDNLFKILFGYGIQTETSGFNLSYPNLKEYELINKTINLEFNDGHKIQIERQGAPEVNVPEVTLMESEGSIQINGDYDFSELNLEITHPDPASNELFRMIYRNQRKDSIEIPFQNFEIPQEIVDFMNGRGLEVDNFNNSGSKEIRISNFEIKTFLNGVFTFPIRKELGDATYWTFPLKD